MRLVGVLALVVASVLSSGPAAADGQRAYVTADPARSDRVGLATQDGWYSLVLGDGCDGVEPGTNVLVNAGDNGALTLQVVDPILGVQDQMCSVVDRVQLGQAPCATNPAGDCDVAFS